MFIEIPASKAKGEIETQLVIVETEFSKCST